MEFLGSAILVLTIQVSLGNGSAFAPVAIGVVLIALVYAGGPISGAHYNPAITLAVLMRGEQISRHVLIMYWIFQLLGGSVGAIVGAALLDGDPVTVKVGAGHSTSTALLAEVVFTFSLCLVVLLVATHNDVKGNSYFGAAIGLVVMAGAITVGDISGGAFNPAVALGLGVAASSLEGYTFAVVIANFLGGAMAAAAFSLIVVTMPDPASSSVSETTGLLA